MAKRAQSGINAAILVAIIAVAIVVYIIFLPTDTKEDILRGNVSGDIEDENNYENVLLDEYLGRLEFISSRSNEHAIDSFNLYTRTEAEIIKTIDAVSVRNGWFENKKLEFNFTVDNIDMSNNLLLSFSNKKASGNLIVKVNNFEIFNQEITKVNIEPINLPKEYLANRNLVQISVSSVGVKFWKTNEYQLEDLKISADITDISTRESKNIFIISEGESDNIEEATLKFVPDCEPRLAGVLEVIINNNLVYSAVPDCGTLVKRKFNPNHIMKGENKIVFSSEKGDYLIDRIAIDTDLKESPSYTNYFDISDEQFKDIERDRKNVNITLEFVDDIEEKEAEVIINGRKFFIPRTKDLTYSKNIDSYIDSGTNSVKIIPKVTLDIRKLTIELED